MPEPISFGSLKFDLVSSQEDPRRRPAHEMPFRMAVLGDFGGQARRRSARSGETAFGAAPIRVDRDNFDGVMAGMDIEIALPVLGADAPSIRIGFAELDDFHPDRLYARLEVFKALRDTRAALKDPALFDATAQKMRRQISDASVLGSAPKEDEFPGDIPLPSEGSLLDQVVAQTAEQVPAADKASTAEWEGFLHTIVQPHLTPRPDPQQAEMVAAVDAAAGELIGRILHHPDFQALEAAWQGLFFLVSRLACDGPLELYLLECSKADLADDVGEVEDLRATSAYRLLVEEAGGLPNGSPWATLVGLYSFGPDLVDIELLGRMAKIARAADAPFIAAASDRQLCRSTLSETPDPDEWGLRRHGEADAWQALRRLPEAAWLGLALPRLLLRLPFGADTDPLDSFAFEEMSEPPDHGHYLWANPSIACAYLLGRAFNRSGWRMRPGEYLDIEGLPLHIYQADGISQAKPCAEVNLTQRAAEKMLEQGFMPLVSMKDRDAVRLGRFQSVADPPKPLSGRWDSP